MVNITKQLFRIKPEELVIIKRIFVYFLKIYFEIIKREDI